MTGFVESFRTHEGYQIVLEFACGVGPLQMLLVLVLASRHVIGCPSYFDPGRERHISIRVQTVGRVVKQELAVYTRNSRNEGSKCISMTWRAMFTCPYREGTLHDRLNDWKKKKDTWDEAEVLEIFCQLALAAGSHHKKKQTCISQPGPQ